MKDTNRVSRTKWCVFCFSLARPASSLSVDLYKDTVKHEIAICAHLGQTIHMQPSLIVANLSSHWKRNFACAHSSYSSLGQSLQVFLLLVVCVCVYLFLIHRSSLVLLFLFLDFYGLKTWMKIAMTRVKRTKKKQIPYDRCLLSWNNRNAIYHYHLQKLITFHVI